MDAEIKEISPSELEITAEIPAADFEKAYKKTLDILNKQTNIPGFRAGHIPEDVLREKIGENAILQEAAERSIQEWYGKFIREKKIEAIGSPQASITKMARNNPLGVKLTTAILPAIELPDYKAIAKDIFSKKEEIVVEEKEIDDTLEHLKNTKRKAQNAKQEGDEEAKDIALDDEFARSIGKFETLVELRETVRTNITLEKELKKKEEKRMAVLEEIAKKISVPVPDVMLVSEKEKMMGELRSSIENMGMKFEDYLSHVKKTEEEIKKGWDEQAKKRVTFGLILRAIGNQEHVVVDEKEVDAYAGHLKKQYEYANSDGHALEHLRQYAYGVVKNEQIFRAFENQENNEVK